MRIQHGCALSIWAAINLIQWPIRNGARKENSQREPRQFVRINGFNGWQWLTFLHQLLCFIGLEVPDEVPLDVLRKMRIWEMNVLKKSGDYKYVCHLTLEIMKRGEWFEGSRKRINEQNGCKKDFEWPWDSVVEVCEWNHCKTGVTKARVKNIEM